MDQQHDTQRLRSWAGVEEIATVRSVFLRRVVDAIAVMGAAAILLWLLWFAVDVVLLIFAGVLVGLLLSSISAWISEHTPRSYGWSLMVTMLAILSLAVLTSWFLGGCIAMQVEQLRSALMQGGQQVFAELGAYGWGQQIIDQIPTFGDLLSRRAGLISRITGVFSSVVDALTSLVIVLFLGLYIAIDPQLYQRGMLHLVPLDKRDAACEVLHALGAHLRRWLVGALISMTIIGTLTGVSLWLLGIPLALALGILAGLLEFIPNFGPILSAIPDILLAYTVSPTMALYVAALYAAIQVLESYLIRPLVLKSTVALPPAITLSALLLLACSSAFSASCSPFRWRLRSWC